MKTIWKYALAPAIKFDLPAGAEILAVHTQRGIPVMWALVNTEAPKEARYFMVFGTGHEVKAQDDAPWSRRPVYLGTFQLDQGALVFHAFEVFPKEEQK